MRANVRTTAPIHPPPQNPSAPEPVHAPVVRGGDRTHMEAALRKQAERHALLSEAAAHLLATDDPEEQVRGLFRKVAGHLEVDTFFNFMVDEDGKALHLDFCGGISPEVQRSLRRLEFGQAICGTVAMLRRSIVAEHIQESDYDKAALVRGMGIRAYCCHPLMMGDRLLGTLSFASHTRDRFDEDEVEFLRTICHYVAMAKTRVRARTQIEALNERLQRSMVETHHRVRNNLQVIAALVDLQTDPDCETVPRSALDRIGTHVRSLATIHAILTGEMKHGGVESVSASQMLNQMLPSLESLAHGRRIICSADDVRLPVRHATSLAVMVNELVTNAVKHGAGDIRLCFDVADSECRLQVSDQGPGFSASFEPETVDSTGFELIRSLSRWDLGGAVSFADSPCGGACVTVTFPVPAPDAEP